MIAEMSERIPTLPATSTARSPVLITAILAGCGFITSSMQTIAIPVLPNLPELLSTNETNASWVVTVTLLAGAISTPISGRLGDIYGKKRVVLTLLAVVFVGSIIAAATATLLPIIVGRAMQGVGVGVIPLSMGILRDTVPPERLARSVALISSTLGVGSALGLPASAYVSEEFGWQMLFWISAVLSVLGLIGVVLVVPTSPRYSTSRFDLLGALGLSGGLAALLLTLSKGAVWGWGSALTLGSAVTGVVVLAAWMCYEWRVSDPLVDLRLSIKRAVLLTNITALMFGFGLFASSVVLPKLIQMPSTTGVGLGQSMMTASLCLIPTGLLMMATAPIAARLSSARGPRSSLFVGGAVMATGYAVALFCMTEIWHAIVVGGLVGAGIGFAFAALPTLIMREVPQRVTGEANGLNTLMRAIGTSAASAVMAFLLSDNVVVLDGQNYTTKAGFQYAFGIACAAAVLAMVITACIPVRSRGVPNSPANNGVSEAPEMSAVQQR